MQKFFFIAFVSFYIFIGDSIGQPEPYKALRFLNYNPNWISVSQDETFQTTQQWDQYSRILPSSNFYHPKAIIQGNYLYSALRTGTWDLEGFLLEKRNLQTGEIVWKKSYDMRNLNRQEAPFKLRMTKDGYLQLINFRRIGPPDNPAFPGGFAGGGDASHLSVMEFDTLNGELIYHAHPASNDSTAAEIRQYHKYRTQLLHVEDDTFQWLTYNTDWPNRFPDSLGVYHSSLIQNGLIANVDSAFQVYDTVKFEKSDISTRYDRRCYQYSTDSLFCVNYYHSATDRNEWYGSIDLYDRHLNLISSIDISDLMPFSYNLQIFEVTEKNILLYSTDHIANDDFRTISLRKSGELREVLHLNTIFEYSGYQRTTAIENPIDSGLIIFSIDNLNQLLYLMRSDGQGNLTVIQPIETFLPSYVAYPIQLMYDSVNNNLIAHLMHARYEFINDHSIFHGNWSNWVSMPLDDFVAVEDQNEVQTKFAAVYPNPTVGELNITYSFEDGDRIRLYTTDGQLVENYKTDIAIDNLQLTLPHGLASGTYILLCRDKHNRLKFSNTIILQ